MPRIGSLEFREGPRPFVKRRDLRTSMPIRAFLICWVGSAVCRAQSPPPQKPPAIRETITLPTAPPPDASMPSAVSADIERFVKRSGRDVPKLPVPPPIDRVGQIPPALPPPPSAPPDTGPARSVKPPSPLAESPKIKAAPFAPGDLRFPINLASALRLADARPLIVAAAQARAWVAEAELTQAKVLWLPALTVPVDYIRHDGGGPDFNKGILTSPSVNFFYAGASLYGVIGTTDAIYQPLSARQVLNARHWDIQAAKNDALMRTADAYFSVHRARGVYAADIYTVERARDVVDQIASLSGDLASAYEVDRARNMLADLEQRTVSAREGWRVESARLTRVLRLDPRAVVDPLEHDHTQITLVDPSRELEDLLPIGLHNRPEVASRHAMVGAAEVGIRREKARPFLPQVMLTGFQSAGGMLIQAGIFGIGPNSSLNQWSGRDDISIQLIWQLENFGLGNLARIKRQRALESQSIVDLRRAQDTVAEEVNAAHARLQSAAVRVVQAERALRTGIITLNGTIEGLKQTSRFRGNLLTTISRPQEAVYALQMLQGAFSEYYATVAEYNRAQFGLFHALGYPAREISEFRTPGDAAPVDTSRPGYLPPVGNGPPPASK